MSPPPSLRLAIVLCLAAVPADSAVRITYLANEGVRLESGACDVLIDALQRDSLGDYLRHEPDVQETLETARGPFDRVRLALATHFHLDHWDAGAISRFLIHSPAAVFGGPPQSAAMLPSALKPRVRPLWPVGGQASARLEEAGVVVDAIPLDYGMAVENLAYRVECGGRVVFHLGDSEPSKANFARLTKAGAADVAMVPYWWLLSDLARVLDFGDLPRYRRRDNAGSNGMPDKKVSSALAALVPLMLIYGLASLLHFTHNAVFLPDYPNLPPSLTAPGVFAAFGVVAAVGVLGYLLYRRGHSRFGLIVIALYAVLGFVGLDHYVVATVDAHSTMMNATIVVEVATAAILLAVVVRLLVVQRDHIEPRPAD